MTSGNNREGYKSFVEKKRAQYLLVDLLMTQLPSDMTQLPSEMCKMRSIYEHFYFEVSQAVSMFVGGLLLAIGLCGYFGVFLQPITEISFLIEPSGLGPYFDHLYWIILAVVGAWLILFFWPRLAAIIAIGLIALKWAVLQNLITF